MRRLGPVDHVDEPILSGSLARNDNSECVQHGGERQNHVDAAVGLANGHVDRHNGAMQHPPDIDIGD